MEYLIGKKLPIKKTLIEAVRMGLQNIFTLKK